MRIVDAASREELVGAVRRAGHSVEQRRDGSFEVDLSSDAMGRLALDVGLPLALLRPRDQNNLEELFLTLTQDTARQETR